MPSIIFLSLMNGAAWGGSEELWYRTAKHAAGRGIRTLCVYYHWPAKEERTRELLAAGCRVILLPNRGREKKNLFQRLQNKYSKFHTGRVVRGLPFEDHDLVVVNLGGFEIYQHTWRKLFRKISRYVILFHNYDEAEYFGHAKLHAMRGWIARARACFVAAERIGSLLEEKTGIPLPRSITLVNPVTIDLPEQFTPMPVSRTVIFTMLAALDLARKAQDNLVRAFHAPQWQERDWQLHLYGEGRDREALQRLISSLGLGNRIQLKGHTPSVKEALESSHIVLQITHRDAMPLAVLEAMAMSRPVAVSNTGDMPLWISHGVNGWVAGNASVEEIAKVLENAWNERESWEEMGRNSFRIFREKYPPDPEAFFLRQLQSL